MKDNIEFKQGYAAFIVVSIIVYLIFDWNYYKNMGFYPFISSFQEFGIIFSIGLIFKEFIRILSYKIKHENLKNKIVSFLNFDFLNLFVLILLSHILTAYHLLDHVFFICKDLFSTFNSGMKMEFLCVISLIIFLTLSIFLIWKNKYVNKKHLLVASAILFINLFYSLSYVVFLKHNSSIRETTLLNIVKNNVDIIQCNKNMGLVCEKVSLDEMKKRQDAIKVEDKILEKNIKAVQESLLETLTKSKENIVAYNSFNWCNILVAHKKYSIIAAYNKETEILVLDYSKSRMLLKIEDSKFKAIAGLSTIAWVSILILLVFIHNFLLVKIKYKAKENNHE